MTIVFPLSPEIRMGRSEDEGMGRQAMLAIAVGELPIDNHGKLQLGIIGSDRFVPS